LCCCRKLKENDEKEEKENDEREGMRRKRKRMMNKKGVRMQNFSSSHFCQTSDYQSRKMCLDRITSFDIERRIDTARIHYIRKLQ
jgi:hypothetical protein